MSFSTGLQSKIIRLWNAADITGLTNGQTVTAWTDQIVSDTATPYAGFASASGNSLYRPNAFGSQPGVECLAGVMGTSASVTGVRAIFSLSKFDLTNGGDVGQGAFVVGGSASNSVIRGGGDIQLAIETRSGLNSGVVCYQDGIPVGLALDRKSVPTVIGAVLPSTLSIEVLGGNYFGSGRGTHGAILLLNDVPTSGEIAELTAYFHGLGGTSAHSIPTSAELFFGDSLTSEDSGSEPVDGNSTYPGLVVRSRGGTRQWQNFGFFGDIASGCLSLVQNRGTDTIASLRAAGVNDLTAYVHIGRNNIYAVSPADPNSTADIVQSICTTLRTAGATRIILITLGASAANDTGLQATCDANRATYNARLVAMTPVYADAVVRLDLDSDMGPNGSQTNGTYFTSDNIHWKAPGISRVASLVESQGFDTDDSSSSSHSSASSGSSSSSSSHGQSEASSSSSQSNLLMINGVIDGHNYLTIAQAYADAYEGQDALVPYFEDALLALRCLDDVDVTTSLIGVFFDAYQQAEIRYGSTIPFLDSVRTLQRHVEVQSGLSVADWIAVAVPDGVVPAAWAELSKQAGYDIDSVSD